MGSPSTLDQTCCSSSPKGALWLLPGPDWHVAGSGWLVRGRGQAGEAGALVATEGRVAVGWGALAGSMPSGCPWGPYQGQLPALVSSPAPLLCISAWLSPRMPALPLSSGVTRGDSTRGWRMGDTPFSSGPCQVLGRCQPHALRAAWGPVCARLCLLSHRPFSRCGLLGRACVCFRHVCGWVWLGVGPRWGQGWVWGEAAAK